MNEEAKTWETEEEKDYFDLTMEEIQAMPEEERIERMRADAARRLERVSRGAIHLARPMMSRGEKVEELHYDFTVLTQRDFIDCMDADRKNRDKNAISRTQAMALYGRMHDKAERMASGLDAHDLEEQAGISDAESMIQKATDFFTWSKLVSLANR